MILTFKVRHLPKRIKNKAMRHNFNSKNKRNVDWSKEEDTFFLKAHEQLQATKSKNIEEIVVFCRML